MIHKTIITIAAALMSLLATAQEIPQFTGSDFDGWSYNNPGVELSSGNIAGGKIYLYVNQLGVALRLCSPVFACGGIDSIAAQVNWYTPSFKDSEFVLSRTALTLAIDDALGNPIDSVSCTPVTAGTSNHLLTFSAPVPAGADSIRLRLVSWQANVTSCGAVKRALFQAVKSPDPQTLKGDLDGDGKLSVSDVTRLIDIILNGKGGEIADVADVDGNGKVDVSDVTLLIKWILSL